MVTYIFNRKNVDQKYKFLIKKNLDKNRNFFTKIYFFCKIVKRKNCNFCCKNVDQKYKFLIKKF